MLSLFVIKMNLFNFDDDDDDDGDDRMTMIMVVIKMSPAKPEFRKILILFFLAS